MGHLLLVILHVVAAFAFWPALFVTVPLHLVYGVMSARSDAADEAASRARDAAELLRPCPKCAELIQRAAVVCRHCGASVEALPPPAGVGISGYKTGAALARALRGGDGAPRL
jgi:hypothetical protein